MGRARAGRRTRHRGARPARPACGDGGPRGSGGACRASFTHRGRACARGIGSSRPREGVRAMKEEITSLAYAKRVGERLRAIRKQKDLSLQDVEQSSREEFKASVLGAYERGERAISVPRLQRLARFYNVPVDRLLPGDVTP